MTTDLAVPLAPHVYRADAHPAALYLAHLQGAGRATMASTVERLARVTSGGAIGAETFPWHLLRYEHTTLIWTRLHDQKPPPAPATIRKYLAALRGVLKECWRLGLMAAEDYQRVIDLPRVRGETLPAGRDLSKDEVAALILALPADTPEWIRDRAILSVFVLTGVRLDELVQLDVSALRGDVLRVRGKGNVEREIPLAEGVTVALGAWLRIRGKTPGPLFTSFAQGVAKPHTRVGASAIRRILDTAALAAGVDRFTPHDLRRTFATRSLDEGSDISIVQKLMGHKSVRTTTQYDRRDAGPKRAAVDRLSAAFGAAGQDASGPKLSIDEIFGARAVATIEELHRFAGSKLLNDAIEAGFVRCTTVRLPEEEFAAEFLVQFSGGPDHKKLCATGARWIEAHDLLWGCRRNQCRYESGGISDVMAVDRSIAVECGKTEPSKIVLAVDVKMRVLFIPFRWRFQTPVAYGFLFERTDKPNDDVLREITERCRRNEGAFHGTKNLKLAQRRGPVPEERVKAYARQILGPHFHDPDDPTS
jgi:integrase